LIDGKKILVSKVLKDIDEALSGDDFYRVHSSYLININRIKKFIRGDGGYLIMDNDATVNISRSRKQEFMGIVFEILNCTEAPEGAFLIELRKKQKLSQTAFI